MGNLKKEEISKYYNLISDNILDFHNYEYSRHIESYKKYIGDVRERSTKIKNWQMNVSYPLTAMMVDTIFSTIFDFDYQLKLISENLTKACIDAFDYKGRGKKVLGLVSKEGIITGQGIFRDFMYNKKTNYDILDDKIEVNEKNPTMEYISIFNVMYDRLRGLEDSDYVIIRQFLSTDDVLKKSGLSNVKPEGGGKSDLEKARDKIETLKGDDNRAFSYLNYEAIKGLMFSHKFAEMIGGEKNDNNKQEKNYTTSLQYIKKDSSLNANLCQSDKIKESLLNSPYLNDFDLKNEVVEILIGQDKHVFVNGEYIYTQQIKSGMFNIVSCKYNEMPGAGTSLGMSDILGKMQDTVTGMLNMFLDSLKLSNTIMFAEEGMLNKNKNNKVDIENGRIINGKLQRLDLGGADFSSMNGIQSLQSIAQSLTGVNQMIIGGDSRVQRIAGAFDFAFSQYKSRLTPFTDSIDLAMSKIVKGWVLQYLNYYDEEELNKLYGIDIEKIKTKGVVTDIKVDGISIKEIINENNISFKFDSMFNLKKESQKKIIMDVVQILEQYKKQGEDKINVDALGRMLAGDMDVTPEDVLNIYPQKQDEGIEEISELVNIEEGTEGAGGTIEDVEDLVESKDIDIETGEPIVQEQTDNLLDNLL